MRSGIRAAVIAGLLAAASLTINADVTPQSESGEIQLQLARQFLADGRYQDALEAFQRALTATVPADARATRTGIVQAALRVAEFDIARREALQLVTGAPADPEAATLYGDALWAAGLFEEVEDQYRLALKATPDLARGHHGMARALAARSRLDDAMSEAQTAIRLSPRDLELHHTVGAIYERILERLRALPGVVVASAADRTPIGNSNWNGDIEVEGIEPASGADTRVQLNRLSEGYFSTIGTGLLTGRDFNRSDGLGSPPVAIVSQETVRRFFPDAPAIGRHFRFRYTRGFSAPFEIIGIASNTKEHDLREESQPIVYLALSQEATPGPSFNFALRTEGPPAALGSGVKAVLADIDPRFSLELRTLKGQVDASLKLPRAIGMLAGFFGALALLVASIGLYGTMAYTVSRRRNEIGVRIALGAAQARIVRMVLGDVGRMVGAGIVIGIGLSLAVSRLVATFLYGVEPNDPATLSFSALALVAAGLGAALLPARRAARLDPVAALREE